MKKLFFVIFLIFISNQQSFGTEIDDKNQPTYLEYSQPHQVQLLDTGALYFEAMLKAIESAEDTIDMEYYSAYFCDESARILFSAIQKRIAELKQKHKFLRVRLIFDHYEFEKKARETLENWMETLNRHGIEAKIFNPPLGKANRNQRDHQKRMIVDGKLVIMGGRLPGNPYLAYDKWFNRIDKDIYIKGPVAADIDKHFNYIFNNKLSSDTFIRPEDKDRPEGRKMYEQHHPNKNDYADMETFRGCLEPIEHTPEQRKTLQEAAAKDAQRSPVIQATELAIGLDYPGIYTKAKTFIPHYQSSVASAKKNVVMENQYFIPTDEDEKIYSDLLKKGVDLKVLSNSYASGDDPVVDAFTLMKTKEFAEKYPDLALYLFKGALPADHMVIWRPETAKAKWQIHSKATVIDDKDSWVGSNNIDPRSANINLETAVLIKNNPEFAKILKESIQANIKQSIPVKPENACQINEVSEDPSTFSTIKSLDRSLRQMFIWLY